MADLRVVLFRTTVYVKVFFCTVRFSFSCSFTLARECVRLCDDVLSTTSVTCEEVVQCPIASLMSTSGTSPHATEFDHSTSVCKGNWSWPKLALSLRHCV